MSPEAIKATLIAKALHQMANASANLSLVAARAQYETVRYEEWQSDHQALAGFWQERYDTAAKNLDDLLEPLPPG